MVKMRASTASRISVAAQDLAYCHSLAYTDRQSLFHMQVVRRCAILVAYDNFVWFDMGKSRKIPSTVYFARHAFAMVTNCFRYFSCFSGHNLSSSLHAGDVKAILII